MHTIVITGGAGFIGNHVVRRFVQQYPDYHIICLDVLTYAGNLANLADVENAPNYEFARLDICDYAAVRRLFEEKHVDGIIHLAAESHVDRSIKDPMCFARTNVMGTLSLLQAARDYWESLPERYAGKRFYHISTDEVYGALAITRPGDTAPYGDDFFVETTPYSPHSPYSASKASSDHFVRAYHDTYGMPTLISNCSNNYGPYHFPEKLIPLMIVKALADEQLPVYGDGANVRDWLYVEDHCRAIDLVLQKGRTGEVYNIGGHNERANIDVVKVILRSLKKPESLISYVADRKGHDRRYAIDPTKIHTELGWLPETRFEDGIERTIAWYLENRAWWQHILDGSYRKAYPSA